MQNSCKFKNEACKDKNGTETTRFTWLCYRHTLQSRSQETYSSQRHALMFPRWVMRWLRLTPSRLKVSELTMIKENKIQNRKRFFYDTVSTLSRCWTCIWKQLRSTSDQHWSYIIMVSDTVQGTIAWAQSTLWLWVSLSYIKTSIVWSYWKKKLHRMRATGDVKSFSFQSAACSMARVWDETCRVRALEPPLLPSMKSILVEIQHSTLSSLT